MKVKRRLKEPDAPVAITHYSCSQWAYPQTHEIHGMHLYYKGKFQSFEADNPIEEIEAMQRFRDAIQAVIADGGIIYSWAQDSPIFSPQAINNRYRELTGMELNISYRENVVNLAWELVKIYGSDYCNHPRLDNLAALNNWKGSTTDEDTPIFDQTRTSLIVKIYYAAISGALRIKSDADRENEFIARLKSELRAEPSNEKLLSRREAIDLLQITSQTMYNWTSSEPPKIPFTKIGRRMYFLRSAILESNSNH